jgi:ribonuclease E
MPMQHKNESASLIKRFWHKLVGTSPTEHDAAPESRVSTDVIIESVSTSGETAQHSDRNRNNNNRRNQKNKRQNDRKDRPAGTAPQQQPVAQAPQADQEAAKDNRPPRQPRELGRNVRRNLAPAVPDTAENDSVSAPVTTEIPAKVAEPNAVEIIVNTAATEEQATETQARPANSKNNTRRGPNRRRPRNPNYKKRDGADTNGNGDTGSSEGSHEPVSASTTTYAAEFAERKAKTESAESAKPSVAAIVEPRAKTPDESRNNTESES